MTTLGFLYPGHFAEDDFPRMEILLDTTVRLVVHHTEAADGAYRADAPHASGEPERFVAGVEELRRAGVESVVRASTGGSFTYGWDGAREQAAAVAQQAGVPASSTSIGFVHAVRELGAARVAVAATYPQDIADAFAAFLASAGVEVAATHAAGLAGAQEAAEWGPERLRELVTAADVPEADVVLVPDAALHTAAYVGELEKALGKPVLTANQIAVREGLRLAGRRAWAPGLGALFAGRESAPAPVAPAPVWGEGRAHAHSAQHGQDAQDGQGGTEGR